MPRFSIIVPTHDRPRLLARALEHVADQRFEDYELLVVDDGSQGPALDGCRAQIRTFGSRGRLICLGERRLRFNNAAIVRNAGLAHAAGELIAFCDDDDYWCDPGHLQKAHRVFVEDPAVGMYFSDQTGVRDGQTRKSTWLPAIHEHLVPASAADPLTYEVPLHTFCKAWVPHLKKPSEHLMLERSPTALGHAWTAFALGPSPSTVGCMARAALRSL